MRKSNMKVFQGLINYGTQAGMLAKGLRDEGIYAKSIIVADPSMRIADLNMRYDLNQNSKLIRHIQRTWILFSSFFKFNVFHFYYGKSLWWHNIDLPFYKLFGKKVVMEYLGKDVDLWLGLNGVDWEEKPVNRTKLVRRVYRQSKLVDKQLVCAPNYYQFVDNSIIIPLAIDLQSYTYFPIPKKDKLVFMHCPTSRKAKKSNYIEAALERLKQERYDFEYKCVTNVTHEQLKAEYISSDIVIDQLNEWYGTVSVEAMALGRPVICGYQRHLISYDHDKYKDIPIINADIYNIYNVLKDVLEGKYDLDDISRKSRLFVEKVHDLKKISKSLVNIYQKL